MDITKRDVTDPLIKVNSRTKMFDQKDPFFKVAPDAVADRSSQVPMFKKIWGKDRVYLMEPLDQKTPAEIDFSGLTNTCAGRLRIEVHKHPYGNAELEVKKAGKTVKSRKLNSNTWEYMVVDFNKEPVSLFLKANGWYFEFGFVTYVVERSGNG